MLKSTGKTVHHTLSVSLVRTPDRSIVLTRQFVMSGGISKGNLQLPDDLLPGSDAFIAFTNVLRNGKPEDVFIQPLTIKGVTEPPFSASLKLVDTASNSPQFYGPNYSKESLPVEEYFSTLYWNHSLPVSSGRDGEFSFYTSDIAGKFRITIQGVASNGNLVSGSRDFTVAKK